MSDLSQRTNQNNHSTMCPITNINTKRSGSPDRKGNPFGSRLPCLLACAMALLITVFTSTSARATNYVVDTVDDVVALDGKLSLREALAAANLNIPVFDAASGEAGPVQDGITFAPTLDGATIALSNSAMTVSGLGWVISMGGPLTIVDTVAISSGSSVTIDGGGGIQIFVVLQGADGANFSGLILQNASSSSKGGALYAGKDEVISLQGMTIKDNRASDGAGLYNDGGMITMTGGTFSGNIANGASGSGGAIFNAAGGSLVIISTKFNNNIANRAGGAIEDQSGAGLGITMTDAVFVGNNAGVAPATAAPGNGGALHITGPGDITISAGRVDSNVAAREGGGLWNGSGTMTVNATEILTNRASGASADDGGGGIFNDGGTLVVEDLTLSGNVADGASGSGGAILSTDGAISVTRTQLVGNVANRAGGAIEIVEGSLLLDDSTMGGTVPTDGNNVANRAGGAIEDNAGGMIVISGSLLEGNIAGPDGSAKPGNGGALHISGAGNATLETSTVAMNSAANEGGGLWNSGAGTIEVRNSTVHSNNAPDGGGLFAQSGAGTFKVLNSTISSNIATNGGGFQTEGGALDLLQVTVAENVALAGSGGNIVGGTVQLTNTIVGGDLVGMVAAKNSLVQDAAGTTGITDGTDGNITGMDPQLSSLNDFGGVTETHFPMSSSPVVNAGDSVAAAGLLVDQRGLTRVVDVVDMGSVERQETEGEVMVTTFDDVLDAGDGLVSLREAIIQANTLSTVDLIMLKSGTYALTIAGADENAAATGDLDIAANITIMGVGAGETVIDASVLGDRVFHVASSASAKFSQLQINGGTAADGGGIFNEGGIVRVQDAAITENIANGPSGSGGGIFNQTGGQLFVTETEISGNRANRAGGGIEDNSGQGLGVTLTNVKLDNNNAGVAPANAAPGNGGGLHITGPGDISITGGTANANVAAREGGALWNGSGTMNASAMQIMGNSASGPSADDGGGGIFNNGGNGSLNLDMVMLGGAEAADGNIAGPEGSAAPGNGGGFHISGAGTVTITGGFIESNVAAREGGGLWNQAGTVMTVQGGTIINANAAKGDAADDGGAGIFNNGGTLVVTGATISNNTASGISGSGGGLFNASGGTMQVTDTTITGNRANRAGGGIEDASGAGLGVALTNVKLDSNVAGSSPGNGGGLHITGLGDATITGGTANSNTAAAEGGGLWNGTGTMTVVGTEVDGNIASGAAADQGGGGLFNAGGIIKVTDAVIAKNIADGTSGSGGGIFNDAGGYVEVMASDVTMNRANRAGGGIEDNSGVGLGFLVTNVRLDGNLAGVAPAVAAPGNGGGLHVTGAGDIQLRGGTANANYAAREGGAIWNGSGETWARSLTVRDNIALGAEAHDGGGGYFNNGGALRLDEGKIIGNTASGVSGSGGGILSIGGTLSLDTSTVAANIANRAGGGVEVIDGSLILTNTLLGGADVFSGNIAGPTGSAAPGNGGAVHISGVATTLVDGGLIANNVAAREGGGLWNQAGSTMTLQRGAVLSSNSASGNAADDGGGAIFNNGGSLIIDGSIVRIEIRDNFAIGDNARGGGVLSIGGMVDASGVDISGNFAIVPGSGFVQHDGVASLNDAMIDDEIIASGSATLSGAPVITGEVWTEGMATLSPVGIMQAGDTTLAAQSTLALQLRNVGSDQLAVSGMVDLGKASLKVTRAADFDTLAMQTLVIVDNDSNDRIIGSFAGLPEGAFFAAGNATLRISYRGGDGNDVTLSSGPFPGTLELSIDPLAGTGNGTSQQMLTIANNTAAAVQFGRLLVAGLPEGVTLDGSAGTTLWGIPPEAAQYIAGRELAAGESLTLQLTFSAVEGTPEFTPSYVLVDGTVTDAVIVTILRLNDSDTLLEFTSGRNTLYQLQHSEDLQDWNDFGDPTVGQSGITTVIDSTGSIRTRFYRVVEIAQP
ncbi:MAG: fibronectin-binding autotransporter adhesin [Verrucomicrobiales bacterium]|jgi:fibronectin-binding autotransporter adhesin